MKAIHTKPCAEKIRLILEFHEATLAYSKSIGSIARSVGRVQHEEYQQLNRAVDRARRKSEKARDQLTQHVADDRC